MPPVITALYGALNAIFNIFLANEVSNARRRHKVSIGEGDHPAMLVAIRTHANNAEFVPLALVVMLVAELCGASSIALHVYGGLLLVARMMLLPGMKMKAPNVPRFAGTGITWIGIVALSVYTLYLRFKT